MRFQGGINSLRRLKVGWNGHAANFGQNKVKLLHTFRQRGGTRLQYIRGLDFVNVTVANGIDRLPTRAATNRFFVDFHPAPRCDDDIRVTLTHEIGLNNAVSGECRLLQLRKQRRPPAISINSSTQRIPLMSGSFHSSKNTLGRPGN